MALFGSIAFAGDEWQDGFAKALDENNLAGALMLAYNSQASPQAIHEALEAFGVGQEEVRESMMLAVVACSVACNWFQIQCCDASPANWHQKCGDQIYIDCACKCPSAD